MTTPASGQNEPRKMKKLISGNGNDSIRSRLPHANGPAAQKPPEPPLATSVSSKSKPDRPPSAAKFKLPPLKLLPAFWTIASVMSFTVNIVLLIALLLVWQRLKQVPLVVQTMENPSLLPGMATNIGSELLGGLHTNFVKMDEANIKTNIHVEKEIPVQFSLNVSGPTDVVLSRPVTINGALVTVQTGGLNIRNASATIVLPEGLVLPINIQNLVVPVDQKVLAVLDVPVDIPLNQTELHEPFVGLQKVVEPWYCLIKPDVSVNGVQVCAQAVNPLSPGIVAP